MKKNLIILIIAIIISICIGYFIGYKVCEHKYNSPKTIVNETKEYKDAYAKGWSYWFSGYGMHGEGTQYTNLYTYGRKYNDTFENEHDAFVAGYQDGFYYVNHKETNASGAEKGYNQYYPSKESKDSLQSISLVMIEYETDGTTIKNFSDNSDYFMSIARSKEFRDKFKSTYNDVNLISDLNVYSTNEQNSMYQFVLTCNKLDKTKCIQALDYITSNIQKDIEETLKYKMTIVDKASISR